MIISPPFLVARAANSVDSTWIDQCMIQADEGRYPLSYALGWHGGIHLVAPTEGGGQTASVRAIADGEVVFQRPSIPQPAGPLPPEDPLTYRGGWTDKGVVVLRHRTEIGEGAEAVVTFFSIYVHLSEIDPAVQVGRRVLRKARLGQAGQIYGSPQRQIHFEIVCDDENLERLVGRAQGDVPLGEHGRRDALFGAIYARVPAGTVYYAQKPLDNSPEAQFVPPPTLAVRRPSAQALPASGTTGEELFIAILYSSEDGAAIQRGNAQLRSLRADGTPISPTPLIEAEAEYDIYSRACTISKSYPVNGRPAPSAVYEMLRFGRPIGPDALNPADVPHWRQVQVGPGQNAWINLNQTAIHWFSDADFPHWVGWSLVDDSANQDSVGSRVIMSLFAAGRCSAQGMFYAA